MELCEVLGKRTQTEAGSKYDEYFCTVKDDSGLIKGVYLAECQLDDDGLTRRVPPPGKSPQTVVAFNSAMRSANPLGGGIPINFPSTCTFVGEAILDLAIARPEWVKNEKQWCQFQEDILKKELARIPQVSLESLSTIGFNHQFLCSCHRNIAVKLL